MVKAFESALKVVMLNERKWLIRSNQNGTGSGNGVLRIRVRDPYASRPIAGT